MILGVILSGLCLIAVAVDEQGDVIQWGRAFSHSFLPEPTLKGKNITQVAVRSEFCLLKLMVVATM